MEVAKIQFLFSGTCVNNNHLRSSNAQKQQRKASFLKRFQIMLLTVLSPKLAQFSMLQFRMIPVYMSKSSAPCCTPATSVNTLFGISEHQRRFDML